MMASQQDSSACPSSGLSARHSISQTGFLTALRPRAALQEEGAKQLWLEGDVELLHPLFLHSCFWESSLQKQEPSQEHVQHAEQGSLPRHARARHGLFGLRPEDWMLPNFPRACLPLQYCCSPFRSLEPGLFWMPLQEGHLCISAAGGSKCLVLHSPSATLRPQRRKALSGRTFSKAPSLLHVL